MWTVLHGSCGLPEVKPILPAMDGTIENHGMLINNSVPTYKGCDRISMGVGWREKEREDYN